MRPGRPRVVMNLKNKVQIDSDLMSIQPKTLIFDNNRKTTLPILITSNRIYEFVCKTSHNLPNCFELQGFGDDISSPARLIVTHNPCDNNCANEKLFIEIKDCLIGFHREQVDVMVNKSSSPEEDPPKKVEDEEKRVKWSDQKMKTKITCTEDPDHDADVYCKECEAEYCEKCFKLVHAFKALSHHENLSIADKPIQLPKCAKHPHHPVEFVCKYAECQIRDKEMCHTCLLGEHKGHVYEMILDQLKKNLKKLEMLQENIKNTEASLKSQIEKSEECSESYRQNGPDFGTKYREICQKFDAKKLEAVEKLLEFAAGRKKNVEEVKKKLEGNLADAQLMKGEIQTKLELKNDLKDVGKFIEYGAHLCNTVEKKQERLKCFKEHQIQLSERMELQIN